MTGDDIKRVRVQWIFIKQEKRKGISGVRSFSFSCYSSENFHRACSPNNPSALNPTNSDTLRVNAEPADARERNYQNLLTRKASRKNRAQSANFSRKKDKRRRKTNGPRVMTAAREEEGRPVLQLFPHAEAEGKENFQPPCHAVEPRAETVRGACNYSSQLRTRG